MNSQQEIITLILIATLVSIVKGSSVNLYVTDGLSLEGPQCPGTVTLLCTGSELVSLRWRYNGQMNIIAYFPDGIITTQPSEAAFFMVDLLRVAQNPSDPNFANFNSSLTVNYSQLQSNNVTDISCGAPVISRTLPVNVKIIQPGPPSSPIITMVTAAYQSGELNSIEVEWNKLDNCPIYGLFLFYKVIINNKDLTRVNQSSCNEMSCVSNLNFTGRQNQVERYEISVQAENERGSSDVIVYPIIIGHQILEYFRFEVFESGNQINGRCIPTAELIGATECSIKYTILSMLRNKTGQLISAPLDQEISIDAAPGLSGARATYFIQFSVQVNTTLRITEDIVYEFSTPEPADSGLPRWGVAIIVIIIVLLLITLVIVAVMFGLYTRGRFRIGRNISIHYSKTETQDQEESIVAVPAPLQCEVCVKPYYYKYNKETGKEEEKTIEKELSYPNYRITVNFQGQTLYVIRSHSELEKLLKKIDREKIFLKVPIKEIQTNKATNKKESERQRKEFYTFVLDLVKHSKFLKHDAVKQFLGDCYSLLHDAVEQNAEFCDTAAPEEQSESFELVDKVAANGEHEKSEEGFHKAAATSAELNETPQKKVKEQNAESPQEAKAMKENSMQKHLD